MFFRKPEFSRSQQLAAWMAKHQQSYVTHAIWDDNVSKVLSEKALRSAEEILRKKNYVSCELGSSYGERGTKSIDNLINKIAKDKVTLPKKVVLEKTIYLSDLVKFDLISSEQLESAIMNKEITLGNKNYPLEKFKLPICGYRATSLGEGCDSNNPYDKQLDKLLASYRYADDNVTNFSIQVALDMLSPDPIDSRLAKIWENYVDCPAKGLAKLAEELHKLRRWEIAPSKVSDSVRAIYNGIAWDYGDVVVLRGNPASIISFVRKNNYKLKLDAGGEVALLHPFENKGQPFALDLTDKDTFIIGPKALLAAYKQNGMKVCFYEEMTVEQLDFFKVPLKLRPNMANEQIAEKEISAPRPPSPF